MLGSEGAWKLAKWVDGLQALLMEETVWKSFDLGEVGFVLMGQWVLE